MKPLLEIIDTANEPNILNNIIDMAKSKQRGGTWQGAGRASARLPIHPCPSNQ
jgi:hypothetical protein